MQARRRAPSKTAAHDGLTVAPDGPSAVPARPTAGLDRLTATPDGLKPARDTEAREQVSEIQRARIVAAMIEVASEQGAGSATIARVVARSGVSRRTFYELFEDREDCFIAAFDHAVKRIGAVVLPAYRQPSKWRLRIRSGLGTLLELLDREPSVARLAVVEALGAGPKALERRRRVLAKMIPVVEEGRREARAEDGPPPLTAEGVVGGVFSLIHSRLLASLPTPTMRGPRGGDPADDSLLELLNPLMAMIVLPYLGPAAARKELARPAPPASDDIKRAGMDPLRDLDMRLTYRTVRVLEVIGALGGRGPNPSNRQIADAAGIRDQGQISKLLARLQHLDLIENAAEPQVRGEPNQWTLTQRGTEVREVLAP